MDALTLSPDVLKWAADQAGKSFEALVQIIAKRDRDRTRVLEGRLTSPQAEKVAKLTGVPFGLLFLKEPPQLERPSIPDLRQTPDPSPLSRNFAEVLEDALRKQQWYIDHLREVGAQPIPFVGKFADVGRPKTEDIAGDIKATLGLSSAVRTAARTADDYFTSIAVKAEAVGVLVMKSGIVKSNTKRPLSVKEFRGFALADPLAPLVFINGRDALVASVFTLVHELAHIWARAKRSLRPQQPRPKGRREGLQSSSGGRVSAACGVSRPMAGQPGREPHGSALPRQPAGHCTPGARPRKGRPGDLRRHRQVQCRRCTI